MLPINLELDNLQVLMVGAGNVGLRKLKVLLEAGCKPKIVEPHPSEELLALALEHSLDLYQEMNDGFLESSKIVFIATSDSVYNKDLALKAKQSACLINVADQPKLCDFSLPAVLRRGDFVLTVSTNGASPALAAMEINKLKKIYGCEYLLITKVLKLIRPYITSSNLSGVAKRKFYQTLLSDKFFFALVKNNDKIKLKEYLIKLLAESGLEQEIEFKI